MAPQVASDQIARYVPPITRDWLMQVDRERGGSGQFLIHDRAPVISDDRGLQVLNAGLSSVTLVIWEEPSASGTSPWVAVGERPVRLERFEAIEVPPPVRHELQDGGFVLPPKEILWLRAGVEPPLTKGKWIQVQVRTGDASERVAKSVNLFTS
jgi:hypothetical protein